MTELTRRTLLASTAAATAVAAVPLATGRSGHAAAPPAGTQAPGWYRYKVGSFEITVVTDGVNRFKLPDNLVSNAKREDVIAALTAARLPPTFLSRPTIRSSSIPDRGSWSSTPAWARPASMRPRG